MKIISHRGNIKGRVPGKENRPSYIDCAIIMGLDVEVDVWYIAGDEYLLGHDKPQYSVNWKWLWERVPSLWLHCKNAEAAIQFNKLAKGGSQFKYFCHTEDPYVLTSNKLIWVHDLSYKIDCECIIPLLNVSDVIGFTERRFLVENFKETPFAVCTDYTDICRDLFK